MSTAAQAAASRANGAKSSGPTTETGKARSAANSFKHGFTSRNPIRDEQAQQDLDEITAALAAELCPEGEVEENLAEEMAIAKWRLNRIRLAQEELLADGDFLAALDDEKREAKLRLLIRYEKEYSRQYQSAYRLLLHIRKEEAKRQDELRQQFAKMAKAYIESPTPGERSFRNEPKPAPTSTPRSGFFARILRR